MTKSKDNTNQFKVTASELKGDLDILAGMKLATSEKNGDLRNKLKEILDSKGYHSKALAIIRDLDAMSDTKRADVMRTLVPMMDAMRKSKWDAEAADMLETLGGDE